ncbi:hypothetical protein MHYP_G00327250 [Metynnis hypsauchen]
MEEMASSSTAAIQWNKAPAHIVTGSTVSAGQHRPISDACSVLLSLIGFHSAVLEQIAHTDGHSKHTHAYKYKHGSAALAEGKERPHNNRAPRGTLASRRLTSPAQGRLGARQPPADVVGEAHGFELAGEGRVALRVAEKGAPRPVQLHACSPSPRRRDTVASSELEGELLSPRLLPRARIKSKSLRVLENSIKEQLYSGRCSLRLALIVAKETQKGSRGEKEPKQCRVEETSPPSTRLPSQQNVLVTLRRLIHLPLRCSLFTSATNYLARVCCALEQHQPVGQENQAEPKTQ